MTMEAWYIDAWCPVDGLAFASRRRGGILHEENIQEPLRARETVYLCPPFFEPEPVGSLATALAATRGHFQTGFYQDEDKEIPFATLADVVEIVRRVYRGGGGRNIPGVNQPLPVAPTGGRPNLDALLVSDAFRHAWSRVQKQFNRSRDDDPTDLEHAIREFLIVGTTQKAFAKLGLMSIVPLLSRVAQDDSVSPRDLETFGSWINLLGRIGLFVRLDIDSAKVFVGQRNWTGDKPNAFSEMVPELKDSDFRIQRIKLMNELLDGRLIDFDSSTIMHILHRVPIPIAWPSSFSKVPNSRYHFTPTFGALLCLATASHIHLKKLSSPLEFVVVMLAAMVLNSSWSNLTRFTDSVEELEDATCKWLTRSLPSFSLGVSIDEPVHWFAIQELEERLDELARIR